MPNNITLAQRFTPILDELYRIGSLTSRLDATTREVDFSGVGEVKVMKIGTIGLGNYSRATGYPVGAMSLTWETLKLLAERGREFNVDRMDNEETFGAAFGKIASIFMNEEVIPEVDAYRFAKYASWSGIGAATPATLTKETVAAAIGTAIDSLNAAGVPYQGRLLYASDSVVRFMQDSVGRELGNETSVEHRVFTWDGIEVIPVPQNRFYSQITLNAGATDSAGGYVKTATTGADLNFLLLHPTAVLQAVKLENLKIFSPDENQDMDAWKFQYRMYHDAFVYDNKAAGIYKHAKVAG